MKTETLKQHCLSFIMSLHVWDKNMEFQICSILACNKYTQVIAAYRWKAISNPLSNLFDIFVHYHFDLAMRKLVFGHMRTAKAPIILRIRAVWSGLLLLATESLDTIE